MNVWVIEILKGKKSILGKSLNFFTTVNSDFLIFIYHWFKNCPTLEKTPNSQNPILPFLFIKMSWPYFIFNSKNCSTLFQILIIYVLNRWATHLEQCVRHTKWSSHHSIVSPPKANKTNYLVSSGLCCWPECYHVLN